MEAKEVVLAFWQAMKSNDFTKWLITSFRSINNIMPITIFIPALTTTLFYSD